MNSSSDRCSIWGVPVEVRHISDGKYLVISPRAGGSYEIDGLNALVLDTYTDLKKIALTNWLVEQYIVGQTRPLLTQGVFDLVASRKPLSVSERANRLLRWLGRKTDSIGSTVGVRDFDDGLAAFAWSGSVDYDEVQFLSEYIEQKEWLKRQLLYANGFDAVVTVKGYAHLAELDTKQVNSSQAFVAMWFDPSMNDAYERGITPGIADAGYAPIRIDKKDHNNKIDDELIAEIRRSRFLVADFTQGEKGARGGVYYEAGFAHGLNIPVIFTCHKDSINYVHFDTRQYNHIEWETPEELRIKLAQRISATIGDGPGRM
jgi:hypothetical protein